MELACEALALELLRGNDPAQGVALYPLGEVDSDGGTLGEPLGHAHVLISEAQIVLVGTNLVVNRNDADGLLLDEEWHEDTGRRDRQTSHLTEATHRVAIELDIVDQGVDPLGTAPLENATTFRLAQGELDAKPLCMPVMVARLDAEGRLAGWQRDEDEPAADQLSQTT